MLIEMLFHLWCGHQINIEREKIIHCKTGGLLIKITNKSKATTHPEKLDGTAWEPLDRVPDWEWVGEPDLVPAWLEKEPDLDLEPPGRETTLATVLHRSHASYQRKYTMLSQNTQKKHRNNPEKQHDSRMSMCWLVIEKTKHPDILNFRMIFWIVSCHHSDTKYYLVFD